MHHLPMTTSLPDLLKFESYAMLISAYLLFIFGLTLYAIISFILVLKGNHQRDL